MPVNVTGVKQLQKAMKDVDKDLNKEMSKNIKQPPYREWNHAVLFFFFV